MKKINKKRLRFVSSLWFKPQIMTSLCILFLICSMTSFSASTFSTDDLGTFQQKTVKGTVKDATTGEALTGVTVVVKGTTIVQLTDIYGKFTIPVTSGQTTLIFSFIGYTRQEVVAIQGTDLTVSMELSATQISEVVVVGYGTQKKVSVVGAISQVSQKELIKSGALNITNAIAGKLSGVLTMQNAGEPGASNSEIIIRGLSSWNGSQPLVLVDGVERDYSSMDPNEINSISVLKDASATAVFGAKGANGVIIVTTKRGSLGKPQFNFTSSYGIQVPTRIPDHISAFTTMSMLNVGKMNGQQFSDLTSVNNLEEYRNPSTPLNSLRYPDVNWFDLVTRPFAPTVNVNFNVNGGTEFVKYFSSLGYYSEGDIFASYKKGYDDTRYNYKRFNYRGNVDFSLTKSTQLSLNVGGELGIKNGEVSTANENLWRSLYSASTSRYPAYFPAWVLVQVPDPDYPDDKEWRRAVKTGGELIGNPYTKVNQGAFDRYLESTLFTDLVLDQKLNFITNGLSFKGKISLSTYYRNLSLSTGNNFQDYTLDYDKINTSQNPWFRTGQGDEVYMQNLLDFNTGGLQNDYYSNLYYEISLNYSNTFGKHSIEGLVLLNRQQKNVGTQFPFYNEGVVGRASYDYLNKYLIEVNIGYTGSERFAPSNRFGLFPSGAFGWVVSKEDFFQKTVPWMNRLKLRYSDGLVGSDYASSRWLYTSNYYTSGAYILEDLGANVTAQWERAHKRDFGIEVGIFRDLITLNVDLFDEYRDNMLLTPQSVTFIVGNSFKDLNLGKIKKHGIEVELGFNKTTKYSLNYYVKGNFGFNENRIIYKDDPIYAPEYTKAAGKPLGAQTNGVLLTGTGYFTSVNDIHNNPSPVGIEKLNVGDYKFLDYLVDGKITNLDKYPIKGSVYPPITYSFSGGFSYMGFDFNFMFQGNLGKYVNFNQTYENEFNIGNWRVHSSQLDYWTPANQDVNHSTLHYNGFSDPSNLVWGGGTGSTGLQTMIEDRFWRKADYLRLKEVYAGYSFNSKLLTKIAGVSKLNIYVTGNNLWTLTKLIEGDPETTNFQQGFYPLMTNGTIGMKLTF